MKKYLLAAVAALALCGSLATPNAAHAPDIASRAEFDRVIKNAHDDIERKHIRPSVRDWGSGDVTHDYRGDGYELYENARSDFPTSICLDDTNVIQTCWSADGTMSKRHWGPGASAWLYDEGPDGKTLYLRKRWPGESAPDLFK